MPLGDRIGDAYVRIHADGSGIDPELRRDFKKLDKTMRDLGDREAENFAKGYREGLKRNPVLDNDSLSRGLENAAGQLDARMVRVTQALRNRIREELGRRFGPEVGDVMARSLEDSLIRGKMRTNILAAIFPDPEDVREIVEDFAIGLREEQAARELALAEETAKKRREILKKEGLNEKAVLEKIAKERERLENAAFRNAEKGADLLQRLRVEALDKLLRLEREHTAEVKRQEAEREKARLLGIQTELNMQRQVAEFRRRQSADRDEEMDREIARIAALKRHEEELSKARLLGIQTEIHMSRQAEEFRKRQAKQIEELQDSWDGLTERVAKYARGAALAGENQEHLTRTLKDLRTQLRDNDLQTRSTEREFRRLTRTLIVASPRLGHYDDQWRKLSRTMGGFFGHGARNDFLNIVGRSVTGLLTVVGRVTTGVARLGFVIGRTFREIADSVRSIADVGLKEGFKNIGTTMRTLAEGLVTASGGLIAFAAIASIAAAGVGILSAAISGLAAALTSLVATVAFAAASALPALTAAVLPLVAAVGVAIAAYKGLSDAQKEALSADLKPLSNSFGELADAAGKVLFQDVGKWARQLKPVIDSLEPGVVGVADAIRTTLGDAIKSASESPGFQQFVDRFNVFLPNAVRKLGDIFTNVFEGVGGFLIAMIPAMNRFLDWIEDVTQKFADWANDKDGRRQIREFFEKAGDSASALGDFLGQAVEALGRLLDLGRERGDEMFREMADAIEEFIVWITSPQGQKAAEDWLTWGENLAGTLGDLVVGVGKFIGAMDTPAMRTILSFILDSFTKILEVIGFFGPEIGLVFLGPLGVVAFAVKELVDLFQSLWDLLSIDIPQGGWLGTIAGILGNITNPLGGFVDAIGAAKDMLFGGGEREPFLAEVFASIESSGPGVINTIDQIVASLDQVTGAATESTRAMILANAENQGYIDTAAGLGISARDTVSAILGQKDALQRVKEALFRAATSTGGLSEEEEALQEAIGLASGFLKKQREDLQKNAIVVQDFKGKLRGLPERVKVQIEESGIRQTVKGIGEVVETAKDLAPNLTRRDIKTIISAAGAEPTRKLIQAVMKEVERLDKAEAEASVDLDTKEFDQKNNQVDQDLKTTDKKKAVPAVSMDLRQFLNDKGKVMGDLVALSREEAKPGARIDLTQFFNDRGLLINSLNTIPDETVHVNVVRNDAGPTGGAHGENEGGPDLGRTVAGAPSINVPQIVINEAADGKATAREMLNSLAALSY